MTRDEILSLKAGRSLNVHVSEEIMENKVIIDAILGETEIHTSNKGESVYGRILPYSEDLSCAQLVVSKMINLGYPEAKLWESEQRPDVICRAALLTVLDKKKRKKKKHGRNSLYVVK